MKINIHSEVHNPVIVESTHNMPRIQFNYRIGSLGLRIMIHNYVQRLVGVYHFDQDLKYVNSDKLQKRKAMSDFQSLHGLARGLFPRSNDTLQPRTRFCHILRVVFHCNHFSHSLFPEVSTKRRLCTKYDTSVWIDSKVTFVLLFQLLQFIQ